MEFIEFKKQGVWLHFLREKCGQSAQCKLCKTILKTVGGSTKGLHEHLKRRHDVTLKRKAEDDGEALSEHPTPKARKTATSAGPMTKFLLDRNENTLQAVIARMTARDGLPFQVFTTSHDLRRGLTALGLGNLPTSAESVKQLVINQGRRIRSFVMEQLSIKKTLEERFSLTFDEWTSARNRRYMNVNVHSQAQSEATAAAAVSDPDPEEHRQESSSDSFAQQLEIIMRQSVALTSASVPQTPKAVHDGDKNLLASIKAEMAVYDSTGKRGRCLQQVYEYLLSCPPTSVEAERAFSAAGVLCTKLRTRLADSTLDTLCFLRSYYRE